MQKAYYQAVEAFTESVENNSPIEEIDQDHEELNRARKGLEEFDAG